MRSWVVAVACTVGCGRIGFDPLGDGMSVADAPIDPALFAWWRFDEGSGATAFDSVGDNDASLQGASWTDGQIGMAIAFTGGSSAVVAARPSLDTGTNQLTIAFWVNVTDVPSDDERLINMGDSWDIKLNGSERLPQFNALPPANAAAQIDVVLPTDEWHHLAYTFDAGTVRGFYDGLVQGFRLLDVFPTVLQPNAIGFYMGRVFDGLSPCACRLDDLRLYARVLTDPEIADLAR